MRGGVARFKRGGGERIFDKWSVFEQSRGEGEGGSCRDLWGRTGARPAPRPWGRAGLACCGAVRGPWRLERASGRRGGRPAPPPPSPLASSAPGAAPGPGSSAAGGPSPVAALRSPRRHRDRPAPPAPGPPASHEAQGPSRPEREPELPPAPVPAPGGPRPPRGTSPPRGRWRGAEAPSASWEPPACRGWTQSSGGGSEAAWGGLASLPPKPTQPPAPSPPPSLPAENRASLRFSWSSLILARKGMTQCPRGGPGLTPSLCPPPRLGTSPARPDGPQVPSPCGAEQPLGWERERPGRPPSAAAAPAGGPSRSPGPLTAPPHPVFGPRPPQCSRPGRRVRLHFAVTWHTLKTALLPIGSRPWGRSRSLPLSPLGRGEGRVCVREWGGLTGCLEMPT